MSLVRSALSVSSVLFSIREVTSNSVAISLSPSHVGLVGVQEVQAQELIVLSKEVIENRQKEVGYDDQ